MIKKIEAIDSELKKMLDSGFIDAEQQEVISAMIAGILKKPTIEVTYSEDGKRAYFNGHSYYLKDNYYQRTAKLHVDIYESAHNMIVPPGHDVHHKDLDESNNSAENLQLLTKAEHLALHSRLRIPATYICEICGNKFEGNARIKHRKICDNPECKKEYAKLKARKCRKKKS